MQSFHTSAQLKDSFRRNGVVGQAMTLGIPIENTGNAGGLTSAIVVPDGFVFLITDIIGQSDDLGSTVGGAGGVSPTSASVYGGQIAITGGSAFDTWGFMSFRRWEGLFFSPSASTWRSSAPGNTVVWSLKYPYAVFGGCTVSSGGTGALQVGASSGVYGFMVTESVARQLGYYTSLATSGRRTGLVVKAGSTSFADAIPAKAGHSIRIRDIHVRFQPDANSTNTLTLSQAGTRDVMRITNNNPAEFLQFQLSPDIYLKAGTALQMKTTIGNTASVNFSYEYVPAAEVPKNHWWACTDPELPSPGAGTGSGAGAATTHSHQAITPYFPALDSAGPTLPKGHQYYLSGYIINVQKDGTAAPDQNLIALSSGLSESGIQFTAFGLTQSNYQLCPSFSAGVQNQNTTIAVDELCVPAYYDKSTETGGSIYVDTFCVNNLVTTPTDGDIAAWAVTTWGFTKAADARFLSNEGS